MGKKYSLKGYYIGLYDRRGLHLIEVYPQAFQSRVEAKETLSELKWDYPPEEGTRYEIRPLEKDFQSSKYLRSHITLW